jgi:predicted ATPase
MSATDAMYTEVVLRRDHVPDWEHFPFSVPAVAALDRLPLNPQITFLIGENGSGKSTIVEALAVRLGHSEIGGSKDQDFDRRDPDGGLHDFLTVLRNPQRKPRDQFFMRAETVYDFTGMIEREQRDHQGYGRDFRAYGGISLNQRSHGEAFMAIVQNRFRSNSFFLLDEPEAALSPLRQMTLLAEMHKLIQSGCQFVVATHSPILMAYPGATIYELTAEGIAEVAYKETEHYRLTKAFLDSPASFLRHLLAEDP